MSIVSTAGLSSAYQITEYTASSELSPNLLNTGGSIAIPILEVVEEQELGKLLENEVVSIRISPENEGRAFYLLSKFCQFQSLPEHVFALRRADLRFLEEAGIPYAKIG
jgi:hypothetical protein